MQSALVALYGFSMVLAITAFSPSASLPANIALRTRSQAKSSVSLLHAAADGVSRRHAIASGLTTTAVIIASPLEASAQRTLTKAPAVRSNPAPDEDDDEEAAPKQKGKTFATGRKTDDNAGQAVAGVLVGSVVISLPFYWANVKRFFGKYTDVFKASTGMTDGDESKSAKQNEDF